MTVRHNHTLVPATRAAVTCALPDLGGRLREAIRYRGLYGFALRVAARCVAPLGTVQIAYLFARDLSRPVEPARAKVEVTIGPATAADIAELAHLFEGRDDPGPDKVAAAERTIAERFGRGHVCFVARAGQRIVHGNWLSFGWQASLAGRYIVLDRDEAYCGGCITAVEWRGLGIHAVVHAAMLRYLQQHRYARAYTFAYADNLSARKTIERMGWTRIGIMLAFVPRGQARARIARLRGRLEPFVAERIAA